MPFAKISVTRGRPLEMEREIMIRVQRAITSAFELPEPDSVRLVHHDEGLLLGPAGTDAGFVLIEVTLFRGRSVAAKRRLYRLISESLASVGVSPDNVRVLLYSLPREDIGLANGVCAVDRELPYQVNV